MSLDRTTVDELLEVLPTVDRALWMLDQTGPYSWHCAVYDPQHPMTRADGTGATAVLAIVQALRADGVEIEVT